MSTMNASTADLEELLVETETADERLWKASLTWDAWTEELKRVGLLAGPMIAINFVQYMVQVVALMVVGHLGELPLSSVGIAISFTNITGFSVLLGLCGGLDTLCGQAFGGKHYRKYGTYVNSAMISLLPICIPISLLWIFMDKLLLLTGQDPLVSVEARKFALWLIPGLVASAIYYPLARCLQCQSLTLPLFLGNVAALFLYTFMGWILVYEMNFGTQAVAFSISLFNWLNVVVLGLYIKYSSSCERTRVRFSKEAVDNVWPFLRFGFPAALMTCLKWWAFEIVTLLAGRLPNPQLETSVLSICLNLSSLHFTIPLGFSITASIRVANELGSNKPEAARFSALVVSCVACFEAVIMSSILLGLRSVVGYGYSNDQEVVSYVSEMMLLLCPIILTDSVQMVLSGVVKGSGWQRIGAYVNLGSFYAVGIPAAVVLGFVFRMRAWGLWMGMMIASIIQLILLTMLVSFTNWQKQVVEARGRAAGDNVKDENDTESALLAATEQEEASDRLVGGQEW